MSLIDEALKRARQEAAKQDAAARELRYRQVPVIPGLRQPARRSWLLPVVIAACLIVGIGLGLALSGRGNEDQRAALPPAPSAPQEPAPTPAAPEVPPSPLPAVVEEEPASPVVEKKPDARPVPEAAVPPARPVQEEEPVMADMRQREIVLNPPPPQTEPTPAPQAPAPEPAAPSAPPPATLAPAVEPGQVRTYQQELPLAGGGTLRLNGIAYSERPVALFGDKVVAPGESVAGYKVLAIEQGRVRLEGQGGVVVIEMQ